MQSFPKNSSRIAIVGLTLAGLALATISWAGPGASEASRAVLAGAPAPLVAGGAFAQRVVDHVTERLDLTEEQRAEIRSAVADRGPELVLALRQVRDRRVEVFQAIHDDPAFEQEIRTASDELATAQTRLALLRAELVDEVRGVLTPAQRDELEAMKANLVGLVGIVTDLAVDRLAERLGVATSV